MGANKVRGGRIPGIDFLLESVHATVFGPNPVSVSGARVLARGRHLVTRRNIGPLARAHSRVIISKFQSIWGPQLPRRKVQSCLRPMAEPVTLHPSIIPRLDPEYASFHDEHLIHLPQVHESPWDPSVRNTQIIPGSSELLPVGKVEDFNLSRCRVRVFTPKGSPPETGWPVFIFFHGGMGTTPPPQGA
jgi:hypothetical protein